MAPVKRIVEEIADCPDEKILCCSDLEIRFVMGSNRCGEYNPMELEPVVPQSCSMGDDFTAEDFFDRVLSQQWRESVQHVIDLLDLFPECVLIHTAFDGRGQGIDLPLDFVEDHRQIQSGCSGAYHHVAQLGVFSFKVIQVDFEGGVYLPRTRVTCKRLKKTP